MKSPKFKVGDKAIAIYSKDKYTSYKGACDYGDEVIIQGTYSGDLLLISSEKIKQSHYPAGVYVRSGDLADSELYNSPLWKALS